MNTSENNWSSYLYLKDQKKLIFLITLALVGAGYLGYLTPILIRELYSSYDSDTDFVPALKNIGGWSLVSSPGK